MVSNKETVDYIAYHRIRKKKMTENIKSIKDLRTLINQDIEKMNQYLIGENSKKKQGKGEQHFQHYLLFHIND